MRRLHYLQLCKTEAKTNTNFQSFIAFTACPWSSIQNLVERIFRIMNKYFKIMLFNYYSPKFEMFPGNHKQFFFILRNNSNSFEQENKVRRNSINLHAGKLKLFSWPKTWKLLCVTIGLFNIPSYGWKVWSHFIRGQ